MLAIFTCEYTFVGSWLEDLIYGVVESDVILELLYGKIYVLLYCYWIIHIPTAINESFRGLRSKRILLKNRISGLLISNLPWQLGILFI